MSQNPHSGRNRGEVMYLQGQRSGGAFGMIGFDLESLSIVFAWLRSVRLVRVIALDTLL